MPTWLQATSFCVGFFIVWWSLLTLITLYMWVEYVADKQKLKRFTMGWPVMLVLVAAAETLVWVYHNLATYVFGGLASIVGVVFVVIIERQLPSEYYRLP